MNKTKHNKTTSLAMEYKSTIKDKNDFSNFMLSGPTNLQQQDKILTAAWIETPLGPMLAIADDALLYLLEFIERKNLEHELQKLRNKTKSTIVFGQTAPIISIENEIHAYFAGELKKFNTPFSLLGSPFQQLVWQTLMRIPYGETKSYLSQAVLMDKPSAVRAVANANATNQLAIVVPCHRIINNNGNLGGYGGGIARKKWLLQHEERYK